MGGNSFLLKIHLRSARRIQNLCDTNKGFYVKADQFVAAARQVPHEYSSTLSSLQDQLDHLPEIDCLLIIESLDDHCHMKTLKPLLELFQLLMLRNSWILYSPMSDGTKMIVDNKFLKAKNPLLV